MRPKPALLLGLVLGAVLITGCGAGGAEENTAVATLPPVTGSSEGRVAAEAVIEPAQWTNLLSIGGGTVADVLVDPGDDVAEDDLILKLDPTDALLAAEQAQAALAAAAAELAQAKAGPRPEQLAQAEHKLSDAQSALALASAQLDEVEAGATEAEIAGAQAALAAAQAEQRAALEAQLKASGGDAKRQANYELNATNQAVAAAEAQLAAAQGGADARVRATQAGVWLAAAQRDAAQAELDLVKAGATPEDIAMSEAAVQQAAAAVDMAKSVLDRSEIRAPFAGTVTQITVEAGEAVGPGEIVAVLALLDPLQARTVDLTELDVAQVAEGQPAVVTVDGLSDLALDGTVATVGLRSQDYRGDVVYPVTIDLVDTAEGLRWGMTAQVDIKTD
jgi:multidrug efflux pump subunit AcrA (membrane-fusion protein)